MNGDSGLPPLPYPRLLPQRFAADVTAAPGPWQPTPPQPAISPTASVWSRNAPWAPGASWWDKLSSMLMLGAAYEGGGTRAEPLAETLHTLIKKEGGVTFDVATRAPIARAGYAVADPAFTRVLSSENPARELHEWLYQPEVQARLQDAGAHVGGWLNPKTKRIEINVSDVLGSEPAAHKLAAQRGQEAIGHLGEGGKYVRDIPVEMLQLEHRTPHPIEGGVVQPGARLAGGLAARGPVPGAELQRQAAFPELYLPRSYFSVAGTPPEAGFEGLPVHRGSVPAGAIYDLAADPLALGKSAERMMQAQGVAGGAYGSLLERIIQGRGYAGYRAGNTVAMFEPVPVQRVGAGVSQTFPAREPLVSERPVVYHGTQKPYDAPVPYHTTDPVGVHVGTIQQATVRTKVWGEGYGGRILPLHEKPGLRLVQIDQDLGNWNQPDEFLDALQASPTLTTAQQKALGGVDRYTGGNKAGVQRLREKLQEWGYEGIDYPNQYEGPKGDRSHVHFNPLATLTNALTRGPLGPLTELPAGAPEWLGASHPRFAGPTVEAGLRNMGLPQEDITPLAYSLAHHLSAYAPHLFGDVPGSYAQWITAVRAAQPQVARFLEASPYLSKRVFDAVATHRSFVQSLRPYEDVAQLAAKGTAIGPWYRGFLPTLREAGVPERDADMLHRFGAILSEQKTPKEEMRQALQAWDAWTHGEPITAQSIGTTRARAAKLNQQAAGGGPWGAQAFKTADYYLLGRGHEAESAALDRHVMAAYGADPEKITNAQTHVLKARVLADAQRAGLSAGEWQARVWGGQTQYEAGFGKAGATREDWLQYHLASGDFDRLLQKYPGLQKLAERGAIRSEELPQAEMDALQDELPGILFPKKSRPRRRP